MGAFFRWLLAPVAARFMRSRNAIKLPLIAATFTIPVLVALLAQPFPLFSLAGALVALGWLAGVYLCAAFYVSSEYAWNELRKVAARLNDRDLRETSGLLTREEARRRLGSGQFSEAYNTLLEALANLRELVLQARSSAVAARRTADALADGNAGLSRRATEEAATLERSAAALDELGRTIRENAESCREASVLAADATRVARDGSEVAGSAVATMDRIDESSRRIADIVGVIESIAFQTNILALNAAVEAARAGDEGRGFAVVASEVRSLAQRSAQAAMEIKGLIGASVENVGQGTRLVRDAGQRIEQVTGAVEQVNELIGVIAVASREQSGGVESVNRALSQLKDVSRQHAAAVRESAASAASLQEDSARVSELVERFRLRDDDRAG